jgi:hypothetical protein
MSVEIGGRNFGPLPRPQKSRFLRPETKLMSAEIAGSNFGEMD